MARAATETQAGRPHRARVRARDPGHGRRRGLGERRRARRGDRGGPRVGDAPPRRRDRGHRPGRGPRLHLPPQPAQGRQPAGLRRARRRSCCATTFRLTPRRARGDQGAPRRDPHAGAASTSPWGSRRRGPCSATRRATPPAGWSTPLGLKGYRSGGAVVSEKHANFIVNDARGTAADVRRVAEHVRAEVLARSRRRAGVRGRVRRRLVRLDPGGGPMPEEGRAREAAGSPPPSPTSPPRRRSRWCWAGRRRSTTCRSCPGPRSPTPWPRPATRSRPG